MYCLIAKEDLHFIEAYLLYYWFMSDQRDGPESTSAEE